MELTFVGKDPDSVPDGSPALYRTDRKSWIVQGWAVTDPDALAALNLPEGETCVEIMFLHYAGNGTNTAFEITDEPHAARACQEAFESAWQIATPLGEYRPA